MISYTVEEVARLISKSTCQLFNYKEGSKELPVPNGCSILLEYNQNYYCLSNAHVLADNNYGKTFALLDGGKTTNIGGHIYFSTLPSNGNRNHDTFDIAIVKMNHDIAEALIAAGKIFININDITTGYNLSNTDSLLFAGYPASHTKLDMKNKLKKKVVSTPFFFITYPIVKVSQNLPFKKEFHVLAKYARSKVTHPKFGPKKGPSPRGMSGSGIWLLNRFHTHTTATLIGVLSEYHDNRSLLIGSKIDLYIDTIRQMIDQSIPNNGVKIQVLK